MVNIKKIAENKEFLLKIPLPELNICIYMVTRKLVIIMTWLKQ